MRKASYSKSNKYDHKCPICGRKTQQTSRTNIVDKYSKIDWISDSTFKLSGLRCAKTRLSTCFKCFHSFLLPIFDTSKLYQPDTGYLTRKKAFEEYNPNGKYEQNENKLSANLLFAKSSNEFKRFQNNLNMISKLFCNSNIIFEEFSILDWGGGDGYISSLYSNIIQTVLEKEVKFKIYDYCEWNGSEGEKVSVGEKVELKDIRKKFQLIIFSHVLEHTHDPIKELERAKEYADENTIFIIEVPDERYRLFMGLIGSRFGLNYHVSFFSRTSLIKLMNKCGINSVLSKYEFGSSYRGNSLPSIIAVGCMSKYCKSKIQHPNLLYELGTSLLFTFKKVIKKLIQKDLNWLLDQYLM